MGKPKIYPTGVTVYNPERTWNGYTLYPSDLGAALVDMNGRVVKVWKGIISRPVKMLPGGYVMGGMGTNMAKPGEESMVDFLQADWEGNTVWSFKRNMKITLTDGTETLAAMQHHDFQREGSPTGYYAPELFPLTDCGNTILLTHRNLMDEKISSKELRDERIIEVNWEGEIVWEWNSHEHFEEFGFDQAAKLAMYHNPAGGDWLHINAMSALGPNHWYNEGDERFAPENLICSSRQCNIIFIIEKTTGKIVWIIGPDYLSSPELRSLGQIIGQHHAHMIPKGLPGEGNILVFDNGSFGGYGQPNSCAPDGVNVVRRHYSRVLEFDPVTLELRWQYAYGLLPNGTPMPMGAQNFFSPFISSAQRLLNGNTLITQGADGIVTEVTPEGETVWEFINPIPNRNAPVGIRYSVYRAYRIPYDWVPQLSKPEETAVNPPDIEKFRVPGSYPFGNPEAVTAEIIKKAGE